MAVESFNYGDPAELYTVGRSTGRNTMGFRRFETAAVAIRYCMEELSAKRLAGGVLEVAEKRFRPDDIRALYESADYPLKRAVRVAADAT